MANKKRKTYGIPYQGSKNRIAEWVDNKDIRTRMSRETAPMRTEKIFRLKKQ